MRRSDSVGLSAGWRCRDVLYRTDNPIPFARIIDGLLCDREPDIPCLGVFSLVAVYAHLEEHTIMKRICALRLSVLILGFAITSPSLMAQSLPVPAAAERPSTDATAFRPSENIPHPSPIFGYTRPTEKEKLQLYGFEAFGPFPFAQAILAGGFQQATKSPPEWGSGWDAFGKRVASNFGIELVTTTTHYGIAELFREDDAYYRCQCSGFFPRFRHAVISTFTGRRGAEGHTVFSFGAGTMTALAWYPHRYGLKDGFRMGNYNLAGQAGGNIGLEFIYGGPHTLFSHLRRPKPPDETEADQNP